MKRFISFVMALGMAFMLWGVPIEVSAASSGDCGNGVTWTYDDNDVLTISGTGAMADYDVFGNKSPWYYYWTSIKSIVIEDGVTKIGNYAFQSANATSVTIPNSVTVIGESAFESCDKLESIAIPDSVETIGSSAFKKCQALKSIAIPESVTTIGEWAFNNCSALESVTLPNSITSINRSTFGYCEALTDITIPESVESIGNSAFVNCIALTDITIPQNVKNIDKLAFWYCESLTSVTFEGTATIPTLGNNVFANCKFVTDNTDGIKVPAGYESAYSTALGEYKTAIPHSLTQHTAVSPDCINNGSKEYWECSDCGMIFADAAGTTETTLDAVVIPALGHTEGEGTVTLEPTVTDKGVKTYYCTVCGEPLRTEDIPKLEEVHTHDFGTEWLSDGDGHWHECECGEKADTAPHTEDTGTVTVQPTETAAGTKVFKCTECGYEMRTETVPSTGIKPTPTPAPPPSSSSSSSPTPAVSPAKPDKTPYIEGNNGKSGWQSISEEISEVRPGGTVTVDMNGTTELPKDIAEDIAGKDVDLVLDMGGGISWTINGLSVTDPKTVDMSVTKNTKKIPADIINNVSGERYTMQISLAHDGVLGFTATLNIGLGRKNNGLYANLFYYDRAADSLDFVNCCVIKNGTASIDFTHASDYAIVIDKEPLGVIDDVSAAAGYVSEDGVLSADDTIYYGYACTVFPIIAGLAAMLFIKRRQK